MRRALLELVLPLAVIAMLASMLVPLPAVLLDLLLVGNLLLALVLLVSALYISDPLKLSALPTIILLATLYRLSLNVATTRVILSGGEVGEAIVAFGTVVAQGNLIVGMVVFVVITLVQFIVIAKGSERVAEVSARFTLDALPGKQMSIDADVRAGLLDLESARRKRQELQTESRFYGALDGAMKFVKGDAIAGVVIAVVNVIGGFLVGIAIEGLEFDAALQKYTLYSIGDGLLAQIPALLNSLAAGLIVTRVVRGDNQSLAFEIPQQLSQVARVRVFIGFVALGIAMTPGMPGWSPLIFAVAIFGSFLFKRRTTGAEVPTAKRFEPRTPPLMLIRFSDELAIRCARISGIQEYVDRLRQDLHVQWGLLLPLPELDRAPHLIGERFEIHLRGLLAAQGTVNTTDENPMIKPVETLGQLLVERRAELIDDIHTRRLLDHFERVAPELVSAIVPDIATVTQISELLRSLLRERVTIRHIDLILQSIAEQGKRASNSRALLREVRVALGRVIAAPHIHDGVCTAAVLHPLVDFELAQVERGERLLDPEISDLLSTSVQSECAELQLLVASKESRMLVREYLGAAGFDLTVLAYEELPTDIVLVRERIVCAISRIESAAMQQIAA